MRESTEEHERQRRRKSSERSESDQSVQPAEKIGADKTDQDQIIFKVRLKSADEISKDLYVLSFTNVI